MTTGPITIPHVTCQDGSDPDPTCLNNLAGTYEAAVCLYNLFLQNALQSALDTYLAAIENCDPGDQACLQAAADAFSAATQAANAAHQNRMNRLPQAFEDAVREQCCGRN